MSRAPSRQAGADLRGQTVLDSSALLCLLNGEVGAARVVLALPSAVIGAVNLAEVVTKLRQVDVLVSQGQTTADAIRSIGVTEVTYYRWRQEYGGLKSDQVKRMKDLETENSRLRKAIADLTLDKLILKEALTGKY